MSCGGDHGDIWQSVWGGSGFSSICFLRYCDFILYASLTSFFFICLSFLIFFQPSLHKPSIMAHRVRILHNPQQKTVRMHYASKFFFSSCYSDFWVTKLSLVLILFVCVLSSIIPRLQHIQCWLRRRWDEWSFLPEWHSSRWSSLYNGHRSSIYVRPNISLTECKPQQGHC